MSEHRELIVDLSTREDFARRGEVVRAWLLSSGWTVADPSAKDWLHPNGISDGAGPRLLTSFPESSGVVTTTSEVDHVWWAGMQTSPGRCRHCRTVAANDPFWDTLSGWSAGFEPIVGCASCAWSGPVGDWDLSNSAVCGDPGVVLDLDASSTFPGDVAKVLLDELTRGVGGRWTWVHFHL